MSKNAVAKSEFFPLVYGLPSQPALNDNELVTLCPWQIRKFYVEEAVKDEKMLYFAGRKLRLLMQ